MSAVILQKIKFKLKILTKIVNICLIQFRSPIFIRIINGWSRILE